jgi:hypothetical protein
MSRFGAACIGLILAACSSAPSASSSIGTPATSISTPQASQASAGLDLQPLDGGTPAHRSQAGVAMAFDTDQAEGLVAPAPALDFTERSLLCVFLGERSGRWTIDLQTAEMVGKTLEIEARERPPRQPDGETTTPAACGTLRRGALPAGELKVSAHDTVSDEFITEGVVEVPPAAGGS